MKPDKTHLYATMQLHQPGSIHLIYDIFYIWIACGIFKE